MIPTLDITGKRCVRYLISDNRLSGIDFELREGEELHSMPGNQVHVLISNKFPLGIQTIILLDQFDDEMMKRRFTGARVREEVIKRMKHWMNKLDQYGG